MGGKPIGGQRPKFVTDIEADVVSIFEIDKFRRAGGLLGQPLSFGRRYQAIATAEDDKQRAPNVVCDVVKAEAARDFQRISVGV